MSQVDRLLALLSDGEPHSSIEILQTVYNVPGYSGVANVRSRVDDLRKRGHTIEARPGKIRKNVWWYKLMTVPEKKKKIVYELVIKEDGTPWRVPHVVES